MVERLSNVVRRKFVDYFINKHGHQFIKSSSVLPNNDKSLTFVNAGMNQFKPLFLQDLNNYTPSRICNYQKCIRVGGKTCDLDKIGHDFRHHTFFEMLGNWSFNDYGKQEACEWALDFLVNELELDANKIVVTYHSTEDEEDIETKNIWLKLGISSDRIKANKDGDNFWEMGNSGPCGMSSEIFYPISSCYKDQTKQNETLLEIWNLVFIDRQRLPITGQILPLKNKFVDTGMGLERILSILENVDSNYDTDLFRDLFNVIHAKSNCKPYGASLTDQLDINYRILADHSRMITVALTDGILPGRKGNNFMLRTLIKKCTLISRDIFNQETPRYLIFDLVDENIDILSNAYPELLNSVSHIRRTLAKESKRFLKHLSTIDKEIVKKIVDS